MQLIDENVTMIDTMKDKTYDVAAVKERFGVGPDKVTEILGLMGDTSDNIPGVPGIGPKTAQALLQQYHTLDAVYEHLAELKPGIREKLECARDRIALLRVLLRVNCDSPV